MIDNKIVYFDNKNDYYEVFNNIPDGSVVLVDQPVFQDYIQALESKFKKVIYTNRKKFHREIEYNSPDVVILTFATKNTIEFTRLILPKATIYAFKLTDERLRICERIEQLEYLSMRAEDKLKRLLGIDK